jgi:hypothetical protein
VHASIQRGPGFDLFNGQCLEIETPLIAGKPPGTAVEFIPTFQHGIADCVRHRRTPEAGNRQVPNAIATPASQPKAIVRTRVLQQAKILQGVGSSHPQMIIGGGRSNHRGSVTA